MLKPEVLEAVKEGKFNVWAVDNIDAALEILTGVTAGKPRKDGTYAPSSIHGQALAKLKEMAEKAKALGGNNNKKKDED
jgi:hypothetical protein